MAGHWPACQGRASRTEASNSRACTNACGRLPRSWRWVTSYSSDSRAGGPQAASVAFEVADGAQRVALLVGGQGGEEPAQQEGAFGVAERAGLLAEPVDIGLLVQFVPDGGQRGSGAGVTAWQCAADARQQQGGVDAVITGRALPAAGRMGAVRGGVGQDRVGQGQPAGSARQGRSGGPAGRAQPGDADQPAVAPAFVVQFPYPCLGLLPAFPDRVSGGLHRAPAVGVQVIVTGRGGQQQQRFPEGVELELGVDMIADDVVAAGVAGQVQ